MKRATPPCSSIALLLWSSPPCTMLIPLTTASAVALDDFGSPPPTPPSAFTNPPAEFKATLDVRPDPHAVHPSSDPDVHLPELLRVPRKRES